MNVAGNDFRTLEARITSTFLVSGCIPSSNLGQGRVPRSLLRSPGSCCPLRFGQYSCPCSRPPYVNRAGFVLFVWYLIFVGQFTLGKVEMFSRENASSLKDRGRNYVMEPAAGDLKAACYSTRGLSVWNCTKLHLGASGKTKTQGPKTQRSKCASRIIAHHLSGETWTESTKE